MANQKTPTIDAGRTDLIYGWWPALKKNPKTGKLQMMRRPDPRTNRWHRVLTNNQDMIKNSVLPEDAFKSLEDAVLAEQTVDTSAVQHLRDAGLVIPEDIAFTQHEFDVISAVTAADITVDGQASDTRDVPQYERKAITVPVVSKSFTLGMRTLRAIDLIPGRSFSTTLATAAAQVVREAFENALFNGFGDVKISTATETFGYVNDPDANSAASSGDWGTVGNAEATVSTMINAESGDNFKGPFTLYVSRTQYNEISKLYKSVDNNSTELDRILNYPQIDNVFEVNEAFLADGTVALVQLQANTIAWVEAMPFRIVEWTSPDGMSTHWRVMSIAAPRTASTWNDRSGICISTGN